MELLEYSGGSDGDMGKLGDIAGGLDCCAAEEDAYGDGDSAAGEVTELD